MSTQIDRTEIELLLRMLDDAFAVKTWHGPNLKGSLRGVDFKSAAWRPKPGRHNIWEIAVHAAYWKYCVRRRLLRGKRGKFVLKGSNWFARPEQATAAAWRGDLTLLDEEHDHLRTAVAAMDPSQLSEKTGGSQVDNLALIYGIANHDVYHAGQIQLLKRLRG